MATIVQAAATKGIVISPAYQQVSLTSKQTGKIVTINYTNRGTADQTFRLSTADFGSLDDSGGVAFLGEPVSELEHRYGLASWMKLGTDTLFLPGGGTKQVTVTIENRASLAPGGHYGVVMATSVGDPVRPGESGVDVGVRQVLTSLILLTKEGGEDPQLKLVDQKMNDRPWALPSTIELRFQNTGNVHLVPRGTVEVKNPLGKVVEKSALNEESAVILPESFRKLKSSFMHISPAWMPGRYSVETAYRYDGTDATKMVISHIWYVGAVIVWVVVAIALILSAALLWWLIHRRKKR